MHQSVVAALAGTFALATYPAVAADLPAPMAAHPATVTSSQTTPFMWAGLYFGGFVGFGGAGTINDIGVDSASPSGPIAGGQIGYNMPLGHNLVLGAVGDIGWSDETATYTGKDAGYFWRTNWQGSVRGRLGIHKDWMLPYAEAGVAWASGALSGLGNAGATFVGWTVGAGIEFAVSNQMSANVEYRYSDYGTQTIIGDPTSLTDNTIQVGLNWHLK